MSDDLTPAEWREALYQAIQLSAAFREHLAGVFATPSPELIAATRDAGLAETWLARTALELRGGRTGG